MSRKLIVRPDAEADIEEAFQWYEGEQPGLGHDFRLEVGKCLELIETRPAMFPEIYRGLRKAIIHRFPYSIYFLTTEDRIVVYGCIHQRRHPNVWKSRR